MSYLKFRKYFGLLAYVFIPVVFLFSLMSGYGEIYYIIGIVFAVAIIFSLIETYVVKCPKCGEKPLSFLGQIPEKCPYCGEPFAEE
jgi:hypothetical protein